MTDALVTFFEMQRSIFGICPECQGFFRLSECQIFGSGGPKRTWLDKLEASSERLDAAEEAAGAKVEAERTKARQAAQQEARRHVGEIDPVFAPRKLDADDARAISHPIDFIVFSGLKSSGGAVRKVVLMDGMTRDDLRLRLQDSIRDAVDRKRFTWRTVRIRDDGSMTCK